MFRKCASRLAIWLCLASGLALATSASAQQATLQSVLEGLPQSCPQLPVRSAISEHLNAFYQARQFQPAWTSRSLLEGLLQQLAQLADDGLDPAYYQPERIREQLYPVASSPRRPECDDLLASQAYLQALHHLARGRLRQADIEPIWRSPDAPEADDRQRLLQIAVQGLADLPGAFDRARPPHALYRDLRAAYARQRQAALPAWRPLPSGPTLRPGMRDERSPLLRELLLAGAGSTPALDLRYDANWSRPYVASSCSTGLRPMASSAPPPWWRSMSARPAASISCASTSSACAGSAATSSLNRCWWTSPGHG